MYMYMSFSVKMNKIYHTVETVPKPNKKNVETEAKIDTPPPTHKYMTTHFSGLAHAFQ